MPDAVLIFIMPPSPEELRRRIENRGTETEDRILWRLERSKSEIAQAEKYDYCVVNDDLEKAIDDVREIMKAEKGSVSVRAGELKVGNGLERIIKRYYEGSLVK
jgi:guanylate kinase